MELSDVIPVEKLKQLADDINTLFGFNGTVYYKDNNVLVKSDGWANEICPAIKAGDSRILCATAQKRSSQKALEEKVPVIEECDAGFIKFVIPVFVSNEFAGTLGGCGRLVEGSEVDNFYISKLLKMEEKEVKALLPTVKRISKEKLEEAVRYVQKKVTEALENSKP